ncbi:HAD family hydrolase [Prescottella subtropica]|uniref:HAD family hydrolase n=1 Tax=Prescottella subtropica TaxID=2545757 RepID=UPI0010F5D740|nr:HAD family hydrolase [Prescottella subtropica]
MDRPTDRPTLVASDVDGTLIDDDERVTPRTRTAVAAVVASGTPFVLATGRPPRWLGPVVDGLGFAPLAVCANGAVLYDAEHDRVLGASTLPVETLAWIADLVEYELPGAGLAAERIGATAHDTATPQFVSAPGYEHAWLNPEHTEMAPEDMLSSPAIKMLIRIPGADSAAMAAILRPLVGERADLTYSTNNGLVEVSAPGVTKASGLQLAADRLGVDASGLVAFGDMPNDIPMLEMAERGVAMGNAHPEVKAAADEVTLANTRDGVARVLERLWGH